MSILITGGSRGIGRAIAVELAARGYDLFLVSREEARLSKTADELRRTSSVGVEHYAADLSSVIDIESLVDEIGKRGINLEAMVLNAGIFIEGYLINSTIDDFYATFAVNFWSAYSLVARLLPNLQRASKARIILVGSTTGYEAYPAGGALYGVSKWALRGYAVNLRKELMAKGVGVTLVSPGGTLTDLWAEDDVPEGRLLEPEDIGKLVAVTLSLSAQAVVEEIIVRPMLGDLHL